jgi:hypothetical protein
VTTIRARCPNCGEVDMTPDAIELALRDDGVGGSYRFICPACLALVQRRADERIADLLVSVGVSVMPAGGGTLFEVADLADDLLDEAIPDVRRAPDGDESPGGANLPLTFDDLISFHYLLADDEWLAQAVRAGGRGSMGRTPPVG